MEILKYWKNGNDEYFIKIRVENKNEFYKWREGYFQQIKYINFQTWEYELLDNCILKDHKYYKKMEESIKDFINKDDELWSDDYYNYDANRMCELDWWWK